MKYFFFVAVCLAVAVTASAVDYRNTRGEITTDYYAFKLERKLNRYAGVFRPHVTRFVTLRVAPANSLAARGGMRLSGTKSTTREDFFEDKKVVLVGYDLSRMVDGDEISLKKGQTLYQVGIHTTPDGRSLAIHSLIKRDDPAQYLPKAAGAPASGRVVICPHCRRAITI